MTGVAFVAVASLLLQASGPDAALTRAQKEAFLKDARIVRSRQIGRGITQPWRLTLSDGRLTHDAAFQSVDERKLRAELRRGPEINFVDSWRYDVAAYRLAQLLGLEEMLPVTVERRWRGTVGALSWWIDTQMDELERTRKGIEPPDRDAWNRQMYRLRVFTELVNDTDRNLGNVLITPEWQIRMIDFTRGFRLWEKIREHELVRCDRALLEHLALLTEEDVARATDRYLSRAEAHAVLVRRDLIIAHFQRLIAEKGAAAVLY